MVKKIVSIIVALTFVMCCSSVFAAEKNSTEKDNTRYLSVPTQNVKLKIVNAAYTSKVLNVSTDGTPSSGNNVTIWSWSNNQTQWWMNEFCGYDDSGTACYRVVLYQTGLTGLALNYNQATTKCTIYPYGSNYYYDYRIVWLTGSYGHLIILNDRWLTLGTSGSSLGSQCYWYNTNSPSNTMNWEIYTVT